ncbi:MAG: hypothetical protein GY781_10815, partial [Gammaproteobacteria bacterium]|nr:hypothetical protein [Gammaproteobacteria bacterium]
AGVMPLDEVKVQIVNLLKQQAVREATEQAGIQIITALEEGRTTEEATTLLPEEITSSWQQHKNLGRNDTEVNTQLRNEVFRISAPANGESVYKGILLSSGDYAVVELTAVNEGIEMASSDTTTSSDTIDTAPTADARARQFTDYHSQSEIYGYLKYLDGKASIIRSVSNTNLVQ